MHANYNHVTCACHVRTFIKQPSHDMYMQSCDIRIIIQYSRDNQVLQVL